MKPSSLSVLKVCTPIVLLVAALAAANSASAQTRGTVRNAHGNPVAGATVSDLSGKTLATTGADGAFTLERAPAQVEVTAAHYLTAVVNVQPGQPLSITLQRPLETVTVTAYRSPLGEEDSPASTRVMDQRQLEQAAPPALDGKLREVPGFDLYRRSSSLVANPTTEGVSLRGLGSTAASRSLVVMDDVPLNDPYGGWIHWEELPELSVQSVEVVRGGASDLYGSSAIGGVISVVPVPPQGNGVQVLASGGSESTLDDGVLATGKRGPWAGLGSAGVIATDGYTLIAPDQRGPIDQPSNVHAQNALVEGQRALPDGGRVFARANALNESRHNGTPDQYNLTRLWRAAAGADWGDWSLRLFGSNEHFRQTFSSVNVPRTSEKLTKFQFDPADELGAAARWRHALGAHALILAGADTHDVRATDNETLLVGAGGTTSTSARQRLTGAWGEALYTPAGWTLSGSARVDHFSNFNVWQTSTSAPATTLPSWSQTVFDPRLGVVRRLTPWLAWSASGFRAFRTPTENELYRSFQVGSEVTEPNPNLRSERATGWETGAQADLRRWGSSVRASYFWTQVNRPIASLTLSATPTSVLLKRENLGQIESRGVSLDYAMRPTAWIGIEGGYQYADATVTKNAPEPYLVGNWIPEVPRNTATAQVRFSRARWGLVSLQGRYGGRAFDDDANQFLLHSYFQLDASGQHSLGQHCVLFADGENLFDRSIEVGKTPQTTLGTPRIARVGVRVRFGE
ncbi:MAG: TonB-dependent receptor [Acidobacteriaceae bacterium]